MKTETTIERVGTYRVVRKLATGGTGDVLLAKAEGPHAFEQDVVLKVLGSESPNDDETARVFAREASAYARLSHPSIVRLLDFFAVPNVDRRDEGAQLVMVLEHVDGPALARLASMLKAVGKELEDRAAIYIGSRVFDALAAAHSALDESGTPAPVIHHDVNPSNVLVPWDGQVKLADFGVAKVTGLTHQSALDTLNGTYGYMAPEQVTGDPVTPRADVYAGAVILWELLTKRRAFQRGALPEIEALRAMAEPRLPSIASIRPDVDRTLRDALRRALEPRADRRQITAEEMAYVLASIVRPDEGRDRLVMALNAVRNDARATALQKEPSIRPSAGVAGALRAPVTPTPTQRGVAPAPSSPPRPLSRVETASSRPPPPRVRSSTPPPPPLVPSSLSPLLMDMDPDKEETLVKPLSTMSPPIAPDDDLPSDLVIPNTRPPPAVAAPPSIGSAPAPPPPPAVAISLPPAAIAPPPPAAIAPPPPVAIGLPPRGVMAPPPAPFAGPLPSFAPLTPPRASRSRPTIMVAAVVVCGLGVGIAGIAMKLRHRQKGGDHALVASAAARQDPSSLPALAASTPSASPSVTASVPIETASPSAAAPASAPPLAGAAPMPSTANAAPSARPSAGAAANTGIVKTAGSVPGHRIFVDNRTVGQTPASVTVKCGQHFMRLGSAGKVQTIDVPCGGDVLVSDKP